MRRVLHPSIYAAYTGPVPNFIDPASSGGHEQDGWQIPLEFSHGAFRFGHAMVRPEYVINDHLHPRSQQHPGKNLGERSRQHAARCDVDRAMVALFRDRGIAAQFQPADRPLSQRRAGQRPDISRLRPNQPGRPALSRPAGRRAGRTLVGECAGGRDRRQAAASHRRFAAAGRSRPSASTSIREWLASETGLWRAHCRRHRDASPTIRRCPSSSCSRRCGNRRRGPVPGNARLDHRRGSDLRRACGQRACRRA